jgi:hypothetical protein
MDGLCLVVHRDILEILFIFEQRNSESSLELVGPSENKVDANKNALKMFSIHLMFSKAQTTTTRADALTGNLETFLSFLRATSANEGRNIYGSILSSHESQAVLWLGGVNVAQHCGSNVTELVASLVGKPQCAVLPLDRHAIPSS